MKHTQVFVCGAAVTFALSLSFCCTVFGETLRVSVNQREPSPYEGEQGAFVLTNRIEQWKPEETAIIVCDMWDRHWCDISTARWVSLAEAINETLEIAREKGVKIVHSPAETMDYYKDYPQRRKAQEYNDRSLVPLASGRNLPSEAGAAWPIDASDGGSEGSGPQFKAWTKQSDKIKIHDEDIISDSGAEIGAYLKATGVKNVILTGVATNMCVIERTYGLRAMRRMDFNVVLMRDLTDVMYNPSMPPNVNHFSGLDLMVEYIEKYVCPSIVSSDFTGKKQFRFADDKRQSIAVLCAEGEYHSNQHLPEFAHKLTLKNYRCNFSLGVPRMEGPGRHNLENLQILEDADLMILYVRRRALEPEKMAQVRTYIESGRPVLGIRVSVVAFDTGGPQVPREDGQAGTLTQWTELNRDVWGGSYDGHYERRPEGIDITFVPGMENHPILSGVKPFNSPSWLYKCAPLRSEQAQVLLLGTHPNKPVQPVCWQNGRNIVFTSLGHWDDWKNESFRNLMFNTVEYLLKE